LIIVRAFIAIDTGVFIEGEGTSDGAVAYIICADIPIAAFQSASHTVVVGAGVFRGAGIAIRADHRVRDEGTSADELAGVIGAGVVVIAGDHRSGTTRTPFADFEFRTGISVITAICIVVEGASLRGKAAIIRTFIVVIADDVCSGTDIIGTVVIFSACAPIIADFVVAEVTAIACVGITYVKGAFVEVIAIFRDTLAISVDAFIEVGAEVSIVAAPLYGDGHTAPFVGIAYGCCAIVSVGSTLHRRTST